MSQQGFTTYLCPLSNCSKSPKLNSLHSQLAKAAKKNEHKKNRTSYRLQDTNEGEGVVFVAFVFPSST